MSADFSRIQFTPDLMPSDVVGTNVFDPSGGKFSLRKGPVFTGLLLADQINRTPPKTQSALFEAMQERRVTIDGEENDAGSPSSPWLRRKTLSNTRALIPSQRLSSTALCSKQSSPTLRSKPKSVCFRDITRVSIRSGWKKPG